jgi:hypothetical protein
MSIDDRPSLTEEQKQEAMQAWLACTRPTAIISQAFKLIIDNESHAWVPWMKNNDLAIPYCLGVEMGHIVSEGITDRGMEFVNEAFSSLCAYLKVDTITDVKNLEDLMSRGNDIDEQ